MILKTRSILTLTLFVYPQLLTASCPRWSSIVDSQSKHQAVLATLLVSVLALHRRLALDALHGRQPVLGAEELREVLRPSTHTKE